MAAKTNDQPPHRPMLVIHGARGGVKGAVFIDMEKTTIRRAKGGDLQIVANDATDGTFATLYLSDYEAGELRKLLGDGIKGAY